MPVQDFSRRITIVVRKDLPGWQVANVIGHISAYLGNRLEGVFDTGQFFTTADGVKLPRNSQYPIIIKGADGSVSLQNLSERAQQAGLMHVGFIRQMIESGDDVELEAMVSAIEFASLEFLGIGVFGENEEIKDLTKEFDLWK